MHNHKAYLLPELQVHTGVESVLVQSFNHFPEPWLVLTNFKRTRTPYPKAGFGCIQYEMLRSEGIHRP